MIQHLVRISLVVFVLFGLSVGSGCKPEVRDPVPDIGTMPMLAPAEPDPGNAT